MVRGIWLGILLLSAGTAHAGVTEGKWETTHTTSIFAETTTETGEICLASEAGSVSLKTLAASFAEPLWCEAGELTEGYTEYEFYMTCGPASVYRYGSGTLTISSETEYAISAELRVNIPGSTQLNGTMEFEAEHAGDCEG